MERNEQKSSNVSENQDVDNVNMAQENEETKSIETNSMDYEAKIAELNDKYLRLYSEFDNYRKRTIKEKSEIIKSAGEDVFKSILPTIDDFERAIKANESVNEIEPIKEGIHLIYNKLKSTCTSKGLEPMDCVGKPFDADLMEAITHIPAPNDEMKGKVVDEVEKGYKLGEKVIRFAKVVVGN
jgi:molecular chaperone GrpE